MKDGQGVSCSSHEITKARLHYNQHGAAATATKEKETGTMRTSPEQLAFLVQFLNSPECTERSSYKTADCKGKKRSWLSDILGGGTQPVLHLTIETNGRSRLAQVLCIAPDSVTYGVVPGSTVPVSN